MAVTETGSAGRLRRLTRAALTADSALSHAEEFATNATLLIDDLSLIVDRLDPCADGLDQLIQETRREVAGIGHTRREVHASVEQIARMIDLVEWFLTPAYVARDTIDRVVEHIADLRRIFTLRIQAAPHAEERPTQLAEVRLLAG
jgi:uncharacterized coiled-coil DUF342 family protein